MKYSDYVGKRVYVIRGNTIKKEKIMEAKETVKLNMGDDRYEKLLPPVKRFKLEGDHTTWCALDEIYLEFEDIAKKFKE